MFLLAVLLLPFVGSCIAALLPVNARNADQVPLTIELITAYGSRTVPGVAPGHSAYQSFNTRATSIPAGTVTVKATGSLDGETVTAQFEAAYH